MLFVILFNIIIDFCCTRYMFRTKFRKIYWMEKGRIRRAILDGSGVENVLQGMPNVTDLALDINGNMIYWGNWQIHIIQRSKLDETDREDLTIDQRMIKDIKQWISPLSLELDLYYSKPKN